MDIERVKEYQKYFLCRCPNPHHKDTHPSCILWKDTGKYKCMSCDASGFADNFEANTFFRLPDFDYEPEYYPLSPEAKDYLKARGVTKFPSFLVTPPHNDSVGFLQTRVNGHVIGLSQRMFIPFASNMRYIYQGTKAPYTGDISPFYEHNYPIIVFEKMFGMLRSLKFADGLTPLSSNGSKVDIRFWQRFNSASLLFIMDNDTAGRRAKDFLKERGFNAFCSRISTDEMSDEQMEALLNNAKSILLR